MCSRSGVLVTDKLCGRGLFPTTHISGGRAARPGGRPPGTRGATPHARTNRMRATARRSRRARPSYLTEPRRRAGDHRPARTGPGASLPYRRERHPGCDRRDPVAGPCPPNLGGRPVTDVDRVAELEQRVAVLEEMFDAWMILAAAERRARERANGTHLRGGTRPLTCCQLATPAALGFRVEGGAASGYRPAVRGGRRFLARAPGFPSSPPRGRGRA
jgi:hypothetical protein